MDNLNHSVLITGAAGFIGAAVAKKILKSGKKVIGIDNLNDYYDKKLKNERLKNILENSKLETNWSFERISIENKESLDHIFTTYKPKVVINLAAQAGVRYSIENPGSYIKSNISGFHNILDNCRKYDVENFIYASSSSVYGSNVKIPLHEDQQVNHPLSLYAATKRCNELIAHSYSNIYNLPCTGLRFFTVYGPWGRPDMAPMIFANAIFNHKPLNIFNQGKMKRDFTFIDDIVEGIFRCSNKPATPSKSFDLSNPKASISFVPHRIFNLGNSTNIELMKFISILEKSIGINAIKEFKGMQKGDVISTCADMDKIYQWIGFKPKVKLEEGVDLFVKWYRDYYKY